MPVMKGKKFRRRIVKYQDGHYEIQYAHSSWVFYKLFGWMTYFGEYKTFSKATDEMIRLHRNDGSYTVCE